MRYGSSCTPRCSTSSRTMRVPTNPCCAHSATTWFPIWRSAPGAGSQATRRRERREHSGDPPVPFPPPRDRDPAAGLAGLFATRPDVYGARGALDLRRPIADGRRHRCGSGGGGIGRIVAVAHPAEGARRLPARLRTPADQQAGRDESPLHPEHGEFSVSYPGEGTAYDATFEPNGVVLDLLAGDGGTLRLFGQPADGRTPRQIAEDLIRRALPGRDDRLRDPQRVGRLPTRLRRGRRRVPDRRHRRRRHGTAVLIMVAVKNDYALIAAGAGPYREFSPDFGSGHPSGANFFLALDMAQVRQQLHVARRPRSLTMPSGLGQRLDIVVVGGGQLGATGNRRHPGGAHVHGVALLQRRAPRRRRG